MNINSLNGSMAYANITNSPVDNTLLQDRNKEAALADPSTEATPAASTAFKVSFSRETQEKLAAKTTESQPLPQPPEQQPHQTMEQANKTSRIMDIVA